MDADFYLIYWLLGFENNVSGGRGFQIDVVLSFLQMNAPGVCHFQKLAWLLWFNAYKSLLVKCYNSISAKCIVVDIFVINVSIPCIYMGDYIRLYKDILYMYRVCAHPKSGV